MSNTQTIKRQMQTYQEISMQSANNPNYLAELQNAINAKDVKQFNQISGKNLKKIDSAKGYLRLYQSYVNVVLNTTNKISYKQPTVKTTAKPAKKTPSKTTSAQPKAKKSTAKANKTQTSTVKINLYPFTNYSKQSGLNLIIASNRMNINNTNRNMNTILKFFADLQRNITVYNSTHSKKILMVRVNVKYLSNLKNTAFYSTKRCNIQDINDNVIRMINDLTLFTPQHWNQISPKSSDIIYDLANENEYIVGFEKFEVNYFTT